MAGLGKNNEKKSDVPRGTREGGMCAEQSDQCIILGLNDSNLGRLKDVCSVILFKSICALKRAYLQR